MHIVCSHIVMSLLFYSSLYDSALFFFVCLFSFLSQSLGWAMLHAIPCVLKPSSSRGHGIRVGPIDQTVQRRSSRFRSHRK
ncbi:hypothetical protein F5B17DRAFT_395160 [Nemania serpens]|nr:hypothetical protein F5B17DRAFT_395160 [Nemania serpens]